MKDIGIDLGTTFSVIAVAGKVSLAEEYPGGEGIYLEECDVTVIPSPYGEATFPSALIQDPDNPAEFLFGIDALQKGEEGFAPVMFSKRKIGTREDIPLHAGMMVAKDVACEFLKYLKSCAEQALGGVGFGEAGVVNERCAIDIPLDLLAFISNHDQDIFDSGFCEDSDLTTEYGFPPG